RRSSEIERPGTCNGFLPSKYQGVQFRSTGDPVLYVSNPEGIDPATRRQLLDGVQQLNRLQLEAVGDPEISTHTGWAASTRTCRSTWCCCRVAAGSRCWPAIGAMDSCRASTRAFNFARPA